MRDVVNAASNASERDEPAFALLAGDLIVASTARGEGGEDEAGGDAHRGSVAVVVVPARARLHGFAERIRRNRMWLVLDTSQPLAVVAVVDGARVVAEHVLSETKKHAESLVDATDRALLGAGVTLDAIEGIGVGRGPGSFIGIRTGIAFAKGLALARGIPLVGLPSIVALVAGADLRGVAGGVADGQIGVGVVDAKRGQVFAQRVRRTGARTESVEEPSALTPDDARALASRCAFLVCAPGLLGDAGALATAGIAPVHASAPTAAGLALTLAARAGAPDELDGLVPDYVRGADAKLPASDPASRRGALFGDN